MSVAFALHIADLGLLSDIPNHTQSTASSSFLNAELKIICTVFSAARCGPKTNQQKDILRF